MIQTHKIDTFTVNTYHSTKNCAVKSTINIDEWFSMIKDSPYKNMIESARNGELDYNQVKVNSLPCLTVNFLFDRYKENKNIIEGTGLLYIDIDAPDFNYKTLDIKYIYAMYKSFGGKGYGIIVKVDGLSLKNFDDTYSYITEKLGIQEFVDLGAKKATQFNVLTYDPNIVVNNKSYIFKSINLTPLCENNQERRAYSTHGGVKKYNVRFCNRSDFDDGDNEIVSNRDGFAVVETKVMFKKVSKNRNNILLGYCNNLVWLNPDIYEDRLYSIMKSVNYHNFNNPVDEDQLARIINSVLKYNSEGTLEPKYMKRLPTIIFNTKHNHLTKEEKFKIVRDIVSERKREDSINKITDIINNWNFEELGTITQAKIVKNNTISKKTVEKYYSLFKENIININKNLHK